MSINDTFSNWINPDEIAAEDDVEYFVISEDGCFYTCFFNPLGFEGWRDIASDKNINVKAYHELPDADAILNSMK